MPDTIDNVQIKIGAVDEATQVMENVGRQSDMLAGKTGGLQKQFERRVEHASARMASVALSQLGGSFQLAGLAMDLFGSSMSRLFIAMGPIGWVIAGIAVALGVMVTAAKNAEEAQKKLATATEAAAAAAGAQKKAMAGISDTEVKKAGETEMYYLRQVLEAADAKYQKAKHYLEYLYRTHEQTKKWALLQAELVDLENKKVQAAKKYYDLSDEHEGRAPMSNELAVARKKLDITERRRQAELDLWRVEQQREAGGAKKDMTGMDDSVRAHLLAQEEMQSTFDALRRLAINGVDVKKRWAQAEMEYNEKVAKNTISWADKSSEYRKAIGTSTAATLMSVSEKLGAGERMTIESVTSMFVASWLDALATVVQAKMAITVAEAFDNPLLWGKVALYGSALAGIGLAKGALTRWGAGSTGESVDDLMSSEVGTSSVATGAAREGASVGGISSASSQTIMNVTIAPRYQMLDVSQVTEAKMKEIADTIGRLLREGMATGQYGLAR